VGEPAAAEAAVDLATLRAHFAVEPGDLHARAVVVEGVW
jgi:hypothetical protein